MKKTFLAKGMVVLAMFGALAGSTVGSTMKADAATSHKLKGIEAEIPTGFKGVEDMKMTVIDDNKHKLSIQARATYNSDEYSSKVADFIENSLDSQMSAYINGKSGAKILSKKEIDNVICNGKNYRQIKGISYKSGVEFTLDADKVDLGSISGEYLAYYCWDAIANKPNLCTLSIYNSVIDRSGSTYRVIFPSTIEANEHVKYIKMYKNYLSYIEKKADEDTTMSDMDILIYYYDMVMQSTKYATRECSKNEYTRDFTVHMPVGIVKRSDIVCQCYSVVLNQLLRHSGFVSYNVFGYIKAGVSAGGHAWNAVKLGDNWYYLDSTWDDIDADKVDRSLVRHDFFLFNMNVRNYVREMDDFYKDKLFDVKAKSDSAYSSLYVKSKVINNGLHYANGKWYFVTGGRVCVINDERTEYEAVEEIPYNEARFVTSLGNKLYYGGTDGVYMFDPATGETEQKSAKAYRYGYVKKDKVLARKDEDGKWYYIQDPNWTDDNQTNPAPAPTPNPGKSGQTADDTDKTPSQASGIVVPMQKVKALKGKKMSVKIKSDASTGVEIRVYENDSFEGKPVKSISSKKTNGTWVVTGLKKGSTYYVRARAYVIGNGTKSYSEWSEAKVVKIKK